MKKVTVLKEIKKGEDRVVITPEDVKLFVEDGFEIFCEHNAGLKSGFPDEQYSDSGAKIVSTETAWNCSDYIIKLKAPEPKEYKYLRNNLHIGAFFHLEDDTILAEELCKYKLTAYSYEFFKTSDNIYPISIPQSEISGKMAVIYGAYYLQNHLGGRGILLADTIGVTLPKVVIVGYGNAGSAAAKTAAALGLNVVVLGTNKEKLRKFNSLFPSNVRCLVNSSEVIEREVIDADLVIGTILISTYDTPAMIDEDVVKQMKPGSAIVDITCGYGKGYLPTFKKFTTHSSPFYKVHGVLHCKIDGFPASVAITASTALSKQITPYLINLGNSIYSEELEDRISDAGKVVENKNIVSDIVIDNFELIDKDKK